MQILLDVATLECKAHAVDAKEKEGPAAGPPSKHAAF
jgi:hypothetical protein